jgi:replicative DNA helicase
MQTETVIELFNESAERGLLCALMQNPYALGEITIEREELYFLRHQFVFDALQALIDKGTEPDLISIDAELIGAGRLESVGGASWVAELLCEVPSWQAAKHHAGIVKESARLRALERVCKEGLHKISNRATSLEVVEHLEKVLSATAAAEVKADWASIRDCVYEALDEVERAKQGGGNPGLSTGLPALDRKIGGLRRGNMAVVAGRPGMGKTSLASDMTTSVAKSGKTVGVVSLEMSKTELARRQLAAEAEGLTVDDLERGKLTGNAWTAIVNASASVAERKIFVCDAASMNINQLCRKAQTLQRTQGLDFLVIDYLQLIDAGSKFENRVSAMSEVSRRLKILARELRIPILVLSQVNRDCEKRQDKRPQLSDLRETGAIEQDADVVVFVYRDAYYDEETLEPDVVELSVRKNRHGPTGDVRAQWDGARATFSDLPTLPRK